MATHTSSPSFETPRKRAAPQDDGGVCGDVLFTPRLRDELGIEIAVHRLGAAFRALAGVPPPNVTSGSASPKLLIETMPRRSLVVPATAQGWNGLK
jgi:hypothetical protein